MNGGACKQGACVCPTGIGGRNCEIRYRDSYSNRYIGGGIDNDIPFNTYHDYQAILSTSDADLTHMDVTLLNTDATAYTRFSIVLSNCTDTGSSYTVTSTAMGDTTYTGTGTVSATLFTLKLTQTNTKTKSTVIYTFPGMVKK